MMAPLRPLLPIDTAPLFGPLQGHLLALLEGLAPDEWHRATMAGAWQVRDVVAHLLDGDLRRLSVGRDAHAIAPDRAIDSHADLVGFLNQMNADWVRVARRFSPRVLLDLLRMSGRSVADLVGTLPPHDPAPFAVAWAGESQSEQWFDIGRDYTERWHHQMQIRDAVGAPPLLARQWLTPLLDLSVRCLPHAYAAVRAEGEVTVTLHVGSGDRPDDGSVDDGLGDGLDDGTDHHVDDAVWTLRSGGATVRATGEGVDRGGPVVPAWQLWRGAIAAGAATTTVRLDADTAWRLFYNALPPDQARQRAIVEGDRHFAEPLFRARSVMV
jgi:hypothetical protein